MFYYIDALFKLREGFNPPVEMTGGYITADCKGARNIPPYMLTPVKVMVMSPTGDASIFEGEDTKAMLNSLGSFISKNGIGTSSSFVGWYADQVILPAICANAVICDANEFTGMMRKLDDKWVKTSCHSVERALIQGWFPTVRDDDNSHLTLETVADICGFKKLQDIYNDLGDDLPMESRTLVARIATISALFVRYHSNLKWAV